MAFDNPLAGASGMIGQALPIPGLSEMLGQNKFKIDLEEDISGPRASIDMMWPIYTGGAISAQQKASEAALRQARASHEKTQDELDTLLVQKYFGVQLARSVEKLRADLFKQSERDLNRAKRFEKAGMIAKIERMSAQVNRDAAEREYIGSQTDRKVAETELADLLREESVGRLDTPMFVSKDLKTLSYWQDRALANNPILKALDAQHEQARMGVQAAKSTYHPQLDLVVQTEHALFLQMRVQRFAQRGKHGGVRKLRTGKGRGNTVLRCQRGNFIAAGGGVEQIGGQLAVKVQGTADAAVFQCQTIEGFGIKGPELGVTVEKGSEAAFLQRVDSGLRLSPNRIPLPTVVLGGCAGKIETA